MRCRNETSGIARPAPVVFLRDRETLRHPTPGQIWVTCVFICNFVGGVYRVGRCNVLVGDREYAIKSLHLRLGKHPVGHCVAGRGF